MKQIISQLTNKIVYAIISVVVILNYSKFLLMSVQNLKVDL